jgi:hypothetical protein
LEELGPRILPSIYNWDPTSGNNIDATVVLNGTVYLANWDMGTMGSHTHPITLPTTNDTIVFDGSSGYNGHGQYYNGNADCNVDVNLSGPVVLQNGYTSTITISDGIALNIYGYTDNNIPADFFNVAFAGPNALENFAAGESVLGNFSWQAGGKVTVNGASVLIGNHGGLSQSTASPLIINSGDVGIGPYDANSGTSTFKLTNGSADINVNPNGELDFYMPNNGDATSVLVDNTGTSAWISNNGLVMLYSAPGGLNSSGLIDAPFENHANLTANQGGVWSFREADANNNDLSMDAGTITLGGWTKLSCDHGYTQAGGTLDITDSTSTSLNVDGTGAANFNGGKIVFSSTTGYGRL